MSRKKKPKRIDIKTMFQRKISETLIDFAKPILELVDQNTTEEDISAGFIVAIFMHMMWERLAIVYAILVPPLVILLLILIMALEGDYTFLTRDIFFSEWTNFFQPSGH